MYIGRDTSENGQRSGSERSECNEAFHRLRRGAGGLEARKASMTVDDLAARSAPAACHPQLHHRHPSIPSLLPNSNVLGVAHDLRAKWPCSESRRGRVRTGQLGGRARLLVEASLTCRAYTDSSGNWLYLLAFMFCNRTTPIPSRRLPTFIRSVAAFKGEISGSWSSPIIRRFTNRESPSSRWTVRGLSIL